jgi:hypothetical protein
MELALLDLLIRVQNFFFFSVVTIFSHQSAVAVAYISKELTIRHYLLKDPPLNCTQLHNFSWVLMVFSTFERKQLEFLDRVYNTILGHL